MSQRRQDRDTIASVASNKATIDKALDLIQLARSKTGPGSGFDLSKVSNGIPMACALIASEMWVQRFLLYLRCSMTQID